MDEIFVNKHERKLKTGKKIIVKPHRRKKPKKSYLMAVKLNSESEIFKFPTEKNRDDFINELKEKNLIKKSQYSTTEVIE